MSTEIEDMRYLKTTTKMLQYIKEDVQHRSITESKKRIDDDLAHTIIMNIQNIGPSHSQSRQLKKASRMNKALIKYCVDDRNIVFSDYLNDVQMGMLMLFQFNR